MELIGSLFALLLGALWLLVWLLPIILIAPPTGRMARRSSPGSWR